MGALAIKGGPKVRYTKFPAYVTIGEEEEKAVTRVIRSGVLSRFLGRGTRISTGARRCENWRPSGRTTST